MYRLYILLGCFIFFSCQKELSNPGGISVIIPVDTTHATTTNDFIKYTIFAGQQYCDKNAFTPVSYSELKFVVKFDSSAIYKTVIPVNEYDINKLYGFSDNNLDHHQFSARFGWRWSDDSLRLFAYIYNNGVRDSAKLGVIKIGTEYNCSIKVTAHNYIFSANGIVDTLLRASTTTTAQGYKLYPYFGGDEVAPHNIYIWIKEL